ncbi:unnamed protein product, partial [Heterotrigona itama]
KFFNDRYDSAIQRCNRVNDICISDLPQDKIEKGERQVEK